ncbi:MAG: hypothetical protein KKB51_18905 [Candidatus Riflebacteria bacterium]|nr:hypothetical protein [Candidatus Riflebacteria bacterium]
MKKKALLIALALAGSATVSGQTSDQPEPGREEKSITNEGADRSELTDNGLSHEIDKTTIIDSLQAIRKDPASVKFHSAMCYDMSMPPVDTTFICPACGEETKYYAASFMGKVADLVPYLNRSFKQAKVKIDADFSDFCSKCCKDASKEPELKFTTHCLDCGQTFDWKATKFEELDQLSLLFLSFPITEVNQGQIGTEKIEPEKLSEYLSNRFLCPLCRDKHGLK